MRQQQEEEEDEEEGSATPATGSVELGLGDALVGDPEMLQQREGVQLSVRPGLNHAPGTRTQLADSVRHTAILSPLELRNVRIKLPLQP